MFQFICYFDASSQPSCELLKGVNIQRKMIALLTSSLLTWRLNPCCVASIVPKINVLCLPCSPELVLPRCLHAQLLENYFSPIRVVATLCFVIIKYNKYFALPGSCNILSNPCIGPHRNIK